MQDYPKLVVVNGEERTALSESHERELLAVPDIPVAQTPEPVHAPVFGAATRKAVKKPVGRLATTRKK